MTSSDPICRRKLPVTKYIISCTIEWADVSCICETQGICLFRQFNARLAVRFRSMAFEYDYHVILQNESVLYSVNVDY